MRYDFITIVAVYGHHDGASSIPALIQSAAALPGSKMLLLSNSKPARLPDNIDWKKIPPLNYQQYSMFMMYCLASFIQSDYVLCVQDDGWAFNNNAWSDDFLNFDYIGAINEVGLVTPTLDTDPGFRFNGMLVRGDWEWLKENKPIGVFNGGFSLRSKKYLNTPRDLGLSYVFDDNPIRQNEDLQLCLFMREYLESSGIKYPPVEVAKKFSIEHVWPQDSGIDTTHIFGIHACCVQLVDINTITVVDNTTLTSQVLFKLLLGMGYKVHH